MANFFTLPSTPGVAFDLTHLTLTAVTEFGTQFVIGVGTGTFRVTGYDDTPGYLAFSTQRAPVAGTDTNSWSGSLTTFAPVPEPATLGLFGIGLVALAAGRRGRLAQKSL